MNRHLIIFLATFAVGALIAVILRTGRHQPYAGHGEHPAPMAPVPAAAAPTPPSTPAAPAMTATATVNTICPICGMPVNPALGTVTYKGRAIGLGCKACPPKFAAEPEKYGEAALKNQVVE